MKPCKFANISGGASVRLVLSAILTAAFVTTASAATIDVWWNKSVDAGSFTDETMWVSSDGGSTQSPDFDKGADRWLRINGRAAKTNTVYLADYNMLGALILYARDGGAIVLDGENAVFKQELPGVGETVNGTIRSAIALGDDDWSFWPVRVDAGNKATDSTFVFSNSLQRIERSSAKGLFRWSLMRGRFDFAGPGGTFPGNTLTLASTGGSGTGLFEAVFDGVETVAPKLAVLCYVTNSVVRVMGGSMDVLGNFAFDASGSATGSRDYVGTNDFIVCGGAKFTQKGGDTTVGLAGNAAKRRDRVTVSGESTVYTIASTAGKLNMAANSSLSVLDGATFQVLAAKDVAFGATSSSSGSLDDMTGLTVSGATSVFDVAAANSFAVNYNSSAAFSDGATVLLPKANVVGGQKKAGSLSSMSISGDGTTVTVAGTDNGTQVLRVGESGGAGRLDVSGGVLRGATANHAFMLRLGISQGDVGTLNISGGTVDVGSGTYSQCYVGMSGHGTLNVSGGIMTGRNLYIGFGDAMTAAQTGTVFQTGGIIDMANDGLTLCQTGDSANRIAIVNLCGGTTMVSRVIGLKTVARGFHGHAELHANGGTLVPKESKYTESAPFIYGIDDFTVGANGLTIDTGSFDTLVRQPMSDETGESGLLVKKGAATLLLAGGGYDVSNTRVDEGTLLVTNATTTFATALTVAGSGTLSMQGSAAALALGSLTVNGGTIALDPGDVINVSGSVSLSDLHLSFSSLPELDAGEANFMVCNGELDAESERALRRALCENAVPTGTYVEFKSSYDAGTGKTTIGVVYATEAAPLDDSDATFWNGSGSNWSAVGNWSLGVPTAAKLAVFPEVSGKAVSVDGAAEAAAVSFRADGYSVSGSGSLSIKGDRGAALVEATAGSASIGVPVVLDTVTKIPVAAGASIAFNNSISDGGIEKTGSGALTLAGANDFFREVVLLGGVTTLANAEAAAGAPDVQIGGNATLAVSAAQTLPAALSTDSTYAAPAILKADAAVTLPGVSVTGALIKRGAGKVTLAPPASDASSVLTTVKATGTDGLPSNRSVTYFPADGSAPAAQGWSGFTVAEGEFAVKGAGGVPTVCANGAVSIGMNATNMDENAQARLTIDGATFDNATVSLSSKMAVGAGTSLQYSRQFTPTLAVVNGGFLKTYKLVVGYDTYGGSGRHATLLVTNSTVYASGNMQLSASVAADNAAVTRAKNSDLLTAGNFYMQGAFDVEVDGTFVGKGNATGARLLAPVAMRVDDYNKQQPGGTFALRNGSVLSAYFENMQHPTNPIKFIWNDSEWRWANPLGSYTFAASSVNTSLFTFEMEGAGIVLKPAAGATFTTEVPFTGEGGMRNLGSGTVKFAADTYKFTGACEVAEGATVDLSDAGTVTGATFKGVGTVSGGAFSGKTRILLTGVADDWTGAEVPTFDGCSFGGTVWIDFGRSAENPLDDPAPDAGGVVVAKFANGTPDVSGWKLLSSSTGVRSVRGTFAVDAAAGEVRMTPEHVGAILIVR